MFSDQNLSVLWLSDLFVYFEGFKGSFFARKMCPKLKCVEGVWCTALLLLDGRQGIPSSPVFLLSCWGQCWCSGPCWMLLAEWHCLVSAWWRRAGLLARAFTLTLGHWVLKMSVPQWVRRRDPRLPQDVTHLCCRQSVSVYGLLMLPALSRAGVLQSPELHHVTIAVVTAVKHWWCRQLEGWVAPLSLLACSERTKSTRRSAQCYHDCLQQVALLTWGLPTHIS